MGEIKVRKDISGLYVSVYHRPPSSPINVSGGWLLLFKRPFRLSTRKCCVRDMIPSGLFKTPLEGVPWWSCGQEFIIHPAK